MKWFSRCLAVLTLVVAGATATSPLWARPKDPTHMAGYLLAPNVCVCPRLVGNCSCIIEI